MTCKFLWISIAFLLLVPGIHAMDISLLNPPQNAWSNTSQVALSFVLGNTTENVTPQNCGLLLDSVLTNTPLENGTNNNTYLFQTSLSEGKHAWAVQCAQDNTTISSVMYNITIDLQKPQIYLQEPTSKTYNSKNISIIFSATDNLDDSLKCLLNISGQNYEALQNISLANTTINMSKLLPDNSYTLTLVCTDAAGNTNTNQTPFIIETATAFFEVNFSKETYNLDEAAPFTVYATNKSDVLLTVLAPNGNTYAWNYKNQTFPRTETLPYTKRAGKYTLTGTMTYKDSSLAITRSMNVLNTLTATLSASTTIKEGDTITLEAVPSGGIKPWQVRWELSNGSTIYSAIVDKKYSTQGTYTEKFFVNDSQGNSFNQDITITVRRTYAIQIKVVDAETNLPLANAYVDANDNEQTTGSDGLVSFDIPEGSQEFTVTKSGYELQKKKFTINDNKQFSIALTKKDTSKPIVQLITEDNVAFTDTAALVFNASDANTMTCSLYLNDQKEAWYKLEQAIDNVESARHYTFTITNMSSPTYIWKVECQDLEKNSGFSEQRSFTIPQNQNTPSIAEPLPETAQLQQALSDLSSLDKESSQAAQALQLDKAVEKAKKQVERAQRDILNLKDRTDFNTDQKTAEQKRLEKSIQDIVQSTPTGIKVISTNTFVKYPNSQDLDTAIKEGLGNVSPSLKKEIEKFQAFISVSTKVQLIELAYPNKKETITLIDKQVTYTQEKDIQFLIEIIPKQIVDSADQITFINDHQVLNNDPVVRLGLDDRITYYVKKEIPVDVAQQTATVILSKQLAPPTPTGFSIKNFAPNTTVSFILMGALLGLISVMFLRKKGYLAFPSTAKPAGQTPPTNHTKKEFALFKKKTTRDLHIEHLIQQAFTYLGTSDLNLALHAYGEISNRYSVLPQELQEQYVTLITQLCYSIDVNTLKTLLASLENALSLGRTEEAIGLFNRIQGIYINLPENYRMLINAEYIQADRRIEQVRSLIMNRLRLTDSDENLFK